MDLPYLISITPIYISILGFIFIVFTIRVALYRIKNKILIGNGDDAEMLRLIRGQGNFIETVPMALFLLITMEILGASNIWLHLLGLGLVLARISHYIGLTEIGSRSFRTLGMAFTFLNVLISSCWVFITMMRHFH